MDRESERFNQACLLVGRFFFEWGYLESKINDAIGALLQLGTVQTKATTANMTFKGKVDLLRASINLFTFMPQDQKDEHRRTLGRLINYAGITRNKLAHTAFISEDKGVRFLTVSAKSDIAFPDDIWSAQRFLDEYETVVRYGVAIKEITAAIELAHRVRSSDPIAEPILEQLLQALQSVGAPPSPGHQYDDQTKAETPDPQTPEEPRDLTRHLFARRYCVSQP